MWLNIIEDICLTEKLLSDKKVIDLAMNFP